VSVREASIISLNSTHRHHTVCLVLDLRMPGIKGLELHQRLAAARSRIPIISVTADADQAARAQAFPAGAIEFLLKPFREKTLFQAVHVALGD